MQVKGYLNNGDTYKFQGRYTIKKDSICFYSEAERYNTIELGANECCAYKLVNESLTLELNQDKSRTYERITND